MKQCKDCGEVKELAAFYKVYSRKQDKHYPDSYCKECKKARYQKYKQDNPEKLKEIHRRSRIKGTYGLTEEQLEGMLQDQQHRCKICAEDLTKLNSLAVHIDHCHTRGHVRGILCNHCNRGLGAFRDNTNHLQKAIEYLQNAE